MKNLKEVKNDILTHAQALFAKYGFDKTTLSEITSGNGHCKSSIYYHFKNKEDIFRGVVKMEFEAMRRELSTILENKENDPVTVFSEYIRRRIELLDQAVVYGNVITGNSHLAKLLVEPERSTFDIWEKEFFAYVWAGAMASGKIPATISCEAFSNTLSGLLKGIETQYFSASDKASIKELCSTMTELMIHRNPNFSNEKTN